jgi:hypothetical protein
MTFNDDEEGGSDIKLAGQIGTDWSLCLANPTAANMITFSHLSDTS